MRTRIRDRDYRDRMSMSAACLPVRESTVRLESDADASVALLTVAGPWDRDLWQATTRMLRHCLAARPEALIVDLSGLDDPAARSAPVWMTARRTAAALTPTVPMALCIPPDLPLADWMQRLGSPCHLPVYARVRQARVAIAGRLPLTDRLTMTLRPDPEAPSIARNLVTDACLTWELIDLLHPSRMVMGELVTNAVEHARTEMTVVVGPRGDGLHLSVADGVAAPPRLVRPGRVRRGRPLDDRGQGMHAVAAHAVAWGTLPTRAGKVVWATMLPGLAQPRRRTSAGDRCHP